MSNRVLRSFTFRLKYLLREFMVSTNIGRFEFYTNQAVMERLCNHVKRMLTALAVCSELLISADGYWFASYQG